MISNSKEEEKKYQNIITEKLRELLGEYEVDILTEYVWHMAGNVKSSSEFMCNELKDFLGDHVNNIEAKTHASSSAPNAQRLHM
ncbi:nuclear polyadenylated RNA-binding protein NAB2, putative (NAB2) [Plasmodium ovale curtisi]|uniref:Nuclear polyadenylated RNA-binding protein NAB2, putative (NAB2) n=1 Tax=Plasmodium ovale curtisi TaxID=864141 RepID=A0A1A8VXG3_PLAOA|nr:nuclear polyadenylated RNA-binding protein NAB2, putative (NAB2) [Plasmodium ovale curtisi]SBS94261.1 nuclear polyadenylated RNA-binding protein NAB2, putative (NAB2) [Plasmodium ovale curtisi]